MGGLREVRALPVPRWQALQSLRGSLKTLPAALAEAAREGSAERPVWLEVQVEMDDYLSDLQVRVAALCEGLPVEVLRIRRARGTAVASLQGEQGMLDELTPEQVFEQRLASETLEPEQAQRLQGLYGKVLAELRDDSA